MDSARDVSADLRKLQRYTPFLSYLAKKCEDDPRKISLLSNLKSMKRIIKKDSGQLDKDMIVNVERTLQRLFDEERGDPLEYVKPFQNFRRAPLNLDPLERLLEQILGADTGQTQEPRGGALPTPDHEEIIEIPPSPKPDIPVITIDDDSPRSPSPVPPPPMREIPNHSLRPPITRPIIYPPPSAGIPPPRNNHFQRSNFPKYLNDFPNHPEVRVIPSERIRDGNPPVNHWTPPGHHPCSSVAPPKPELRSCFLPPTPPRFPPVNHTQHCQPRQPHASAWTHPGPPRNPEARTWERPSNAYPPVGHFCPNRPPVNHCLHPRPPIQPFMDCRTRFPCPWGGTQTHGPPPRVRPPVLPNPPPWCWRRPFPIDKPYVPNRDGNSIIWRRDSGWNTVGVARNSVPSTAASSQSRTASAPRASMQETVTRNKVSTHDEDVVEVEPIQESQMAPQEANPARQAPAKPTTATVGSQSDSSSISAAIPASSKTQDREIREKEPIQETGTQVASSSVVSDPSLRIVESYIKRAFPSSEAEAILAKIRKLELSAEPSPSSGEEVNENQGVVDECYARRENLPRRAKSQALCGMVNCLIEEQEEDENNAEEERELRTKQPSETATETEQDKKGQGKGGSEGNKLTFRTKVRRSPATLASRPWLASTSWLMRRKRAKHIAVNRRKRIPSGTKTFSHEDDVFTVLSSGSQPVETVQAAVIDKLDPISDQLIGAEKIDQSEAREEGEEVASTLEACPSEAPPITFTWKDATAEKPVEESPGSPEIIVLSDSENEEDYDANLRLKTEGFDESAVPLIELDDASPVYVGSVESNRLWKTEYDSDTIIEEFYISSDSSAPGSPCHFDESVPVLSQPS